MIKKTLLTFVLVAAFAVPTLSHASFQEDLLAQITGLLRLVASLQEQLRAVETSAVVFDFASCVSVGNPVMESYPRQCIHNGQNFTEILTGGSLRFCPDLNNRDLYVGTRGSEVASLQEFLRAAGTYTYPEITGYFGKVTQEAVGKWQATHSIVSVGSLGTAGYGAVGPITRSTIASMCGVTTTPQPTICTLEYAPVCGVLGTSQTTYGNSCQLKAAGATFIGSGACGTNTTAPSSCKVWNDGCNTCTRSYEGGPLACTKRACIWKGVSSCDAYFNTSGAAAPTIHSFTGPTVLSVNTSGTWSIQASDPQNGTLSYRVDWGDTLISPLASYGSSVFVQNTTFSHVYSTTGTYTITITVRDNQGLEAKTTTTVQVGSGSIFSATPTAGGVPLRVTFTAPGGYSCGDGPDYKIEFGDGSSAMTPSCTIGAQDVVHTYTKEGAYTATLFSIPSGFGFGDRTPRSVGTVVITAQRSGSGICTNEYAPVCGVQPLVCTGTVCAQGLSNLPTTTYSNTCRLEAAGASLLYPGVCSQY